VNSQSLEKTSPREGREKERRKVRESGGVEDRTRKEPVLDEIEMSKRKGKRMKIRWRKLIRREDT
jgi:hypothetical protein